MDKSLSTQVQNNLANPTISRRFTLSRISLPVLFLTDEERKFLVIQLNEGKRFVHIGEETIAASSISGISPRFSIEKMNEEIQKQSTFRQMKKTFNKEVSHVEE